MPITTTLQLTPKQSADAELYTSLAARQVGVLRSNVAMSRVIKRSIDARRSPVKVNLTLELFIDNEPQPAPVHFDYPDVSHSTEVVVVGSGPAGLFASLRLIELGYRPILLERGTENTIARISADEALLPLMQQINRPADRKLLPKYLELVDALTSSVAFYRLKCNMDTAAAAVSYEAMRG